MRLFYAGAEVRWLMASTEWPDSAEFRDILESFTRVYQDAARGTRAIDALGAITGATSPKPSHQTLFHKLDAVRLDEDAYIQLVALITHTDASFIHYNSDLADTRPRLSPHVRPLGKLEVDRVFYGTHTKNVRNSYVCYRNPKADDPSTICAGRISQIFLHRRISPNEDPTIEPFVVLDDYVPLSAEHAKRDPYRRLPLLNTKLYYNRFKIQRTVVRPGDIVSHFAALVYSPDHIEEPCIVVRSLDRVRAASHFVMTNR